MADGETLDTSSMDADAGGSGGVAGGGGASDGSSPTVGNNYGTPTDLLRARAVLNERPEQIGPYRIIELISEGGMGSVYKAEQRHPVRRTVALKLIKLGMDTKDVVARFEGERQALAMMDHPNIARVFDGGATEQGRPYFVMEYVPGEPIHDYCDKHHFTTRQRLELFVKVCDAVQHAHMKGIIHRDLKPSNILVSVRDGQPIPKVIDFGVAKATSQKLTERTLYTETGQIIGTPEYMSPEQAEMSALDVDTRSDVYSLGVVLYQLLTGTLPFDPKTLRGAGLAEIQRIIREDEPPRPSTRLSTLAAERAAEIAKRRQIAVDALRAELRRELEWIPLKAMRKDRTQRYRTASELADDISNYLAGNPLIAAPESTAYVFRKLVRRHRKPIAAGAAVLLALVAGVIGTSVMYVRSQRQANRARVGLEIAQQIISARRPSTPKNDILKLTEALDSSAREVEAAFGDAPAMLTELRSSLGRAYFSIGAYEKAIEMLTASTAYRERVGAADRDQQLKQAEDWNYLAGAYKDRGKPEDDQKCDGALRKRLKILRDLLGDDDGETTHARSDLRDHERQMDPMDGNPRGYLQELSGMTKGRMSVDDVQADIERLASDARERVRAGDMSGAEAVIRDHLKNYDTKEQPLTDVVPVAIRNFGRRQMRSGDYELAEPLLRVALPICSERRGPAHGETSSIRVLLGRVLRESPRRNLTESELLLREALESISKDHGDAHRDTLDALCELALTLTAAGKAAEAQRLLGKGINDALEIDDARAGANLSYALADAQATLGRFEDARALALKAKSEFEKMDRFERDYRISDVDKLLARIYEAQGDKDKAAASRNAADAADREEDAAIRRTGLLVRPAVSRPAAAAPSSAPSP